MNGNHAAPWTAGQMMSRRQMLLGMGAAGGAVTLDACTSGSRRAVPPSAPTTPPASPVPGRDDTHTVAFAAGLEALALKAYSQMSDLVNAGNVPAPPPALGALVNTASTHHQAHLDAWNAVLAKSGQAAITEPDPGLVRGLAPLVQEAISVGVGSGALSLEQLLASNYVGVAPALGDPDAVRLAGSVLVVEMQHVAVVLYLLNRRPIPDAFAKDALSR